MLPIEKKITILKINQIRYSFNEIEIISIINEVIFAIYVIIQLISYC